jgi:small-conductance mechanosensitive channel
VQNQRELRNQLDQISRTLDARLGELEGRIESRFERLQPLPAEATQRERAKV